MIGSLLLFIFVLVEFFEIRSSLSPKNIKDFFNLQNLGNSDFSHRLQHRQSIIHSRRGFTWRRFFRRRKRVGRIGNLYRRDDVIVDQFWNQLKNWGRFASQLKRKMANKIFSKLDKHPVISIFFLRIVFQTVPALNYALVLARLRFHHYILGTLLGLPLRIFIYCYFF